jgi:hypothetical protein
MKKGLLLAAAFAMTSMLFAQANDVDAMEAAVAKVMEDATTATSDAKPQPVSEEEKDRNDTEKELPSEKK